MVTRSNDSNSTLQVYRQVAHSKKEEAFIRSELGEELSCPRKNLDSMVACVCHDDSSFLIDGNSSSVVETAVT